MPTKEPIMFENIQIKAEDGTELHLENVGIREISLEKDNLETDETYIMTPPISKNILEDTLEVVAEHISRKRFIKLLMARGIARNGAKDIAEYIHKKYGYYSIFMLMTM